MIRYSSNDIIEVGRLHQGTSAAFVGVNTKTGKKGIYKENGCMLGIDNEDIREKLASDILSMLGINSASIDLVYDEFHKQNACFSNYIISDNEALVTPSISYINNLADNPIDKDFKSYMEGVKKLSSDKKLLKACQKNYFSYAYMCCIIDSYDLKADNLPLVYNAKTCRYRTSPWFDFGAAFEANSNIRSSFFMQLSSSQVMKSLFEHHYDDIKDVVHKVNSRLTSQKIDELFSRDYLIENLYDVEIYQIKERLINQIEISRNLEQERTIKSKSYSSRFKNLFLSIFDRKPTLPQSHVTSEETIHKITDNLSELVNDEICDVPKSTSDFELPEL